MFKKFFPNLILKKFNEIDLKFLMYKNIKGLILDIDNTLVAIDTKEPTDEVINWINNLKENGIKICILSNAKEQRVKIFNEKLGLIAIHKARKPSKNSFNKAMRILNLQPYQIAVVGDQIFTDIYGGNKINLYTILVEPIGTKDLFQVKVKRILEKYILSRYRKSLKKGIKC